VKILRFTSFYSHNVQNAWKGYDTQKEIDIAFMPYLLAKNLGFGLGSLGTEYEAALQECQNDFHACSKYRLNQLYETYLNYGFLNKADAVNQK